MKGDIDNIRELINEAIFQINLNKLELKQLKQQNTYYYSIQYGGTGGGSIFRDPIPGNPSMTVRKVFVRYGWYLDSLQFIVGDDATKTYYRTDEHGATKSNFVEWSVPSGEYITKVQVHVRKDFYDNSITLIGGIRFITYKETKSELYGRAIGDFYDVNLPGYLVGIAGRYGASMDAIQFISTMHLK